MHSEMDDEQRRRLLVQYLGLGLLGWSAPSGWATAASVFGERPAQLPLGQSIYRMSGAVNINDRPATMGTQIKAGDKIQTGKDSEAVFVVGAQAMMVRADTNLQLQSPDARDPGGAVVTAFRLITGKVLSVFGRGRPTRIQTPSSTIGIRGTGVYVEADPERTYFCTCYGVTDIQSVTDPNARKTVKARHHDEPVYILGKAQGSQLIVPAPFINHTDQELMLIETLVGREPPFVFPSQDYGGPRKDY